MNDTTFQEYKQWSGRISGELYVRSIVTTGSDAAVSGLAGRGVVSMFSRTSKKRMVRYLRETETEWYSLITVTYPPELGQTDAKACKDDLRVFLQKIERDVAARKYKSKPFSAFWFMEFQSNGSIHYHIMCTHGYAKEDIQRWWADTATRRLSDYYVYNSTIWQRIHQAGSRIEKIRSGRAGMAVYARKYAAKMDQKLVPEAFLASGGAGRFWGVRHRGGRLAASTSIKESVFGLKSIEKIRKYIENHEKTALYTGKAVDITPNIRDIPAGVLVMSFIDRKDAKNMATLLKFLSFCIGYVTCKEYPEGITDQQMTDAEKILQKMPGLTQMLMEDRGLYANRMYRSA